VVPIQADVFPHYSQVILSLQFFMGFGRTDDQRLQVLLHPQPFLTYLLSLDSHTIEQVKSHSIRVV